MGHSSGSMEDNSAEGDLNYGTKEDSEGNSIKDHYCEFLAKMWLILSLS